MKMPSFRWTFSTGCNAVLQYLVSQGSISTSELAEHMELGVSRARALLKSLVEDGFAQSRGRGRATRYEPVEGLPVF